MIHNVCFIGSVRELSGQPLYSFNVIRRNHAIVASGMYHIVFIKKENIVVDEFGRIICSHLLAQAHTYFYITLLCMHDTATHNFVAMKSTIQ